MSLTGALLGSKVEDPAYLAPNAANFTALTPLTFLARAAAVYPDKLGVVHAATRFTIGSFTTAAGASPMHYADAVFGRGTLSRSWHRTYRHC